MPIPHPMKTLGRSLLRDQVYDTLLDLIVTRRLEPGEKLADKDLASALGVSRTPVRESLRKLEDEGLVQTAANQWTRVAPVDFSQMEAIYPIISALEQLALPSAIATITDDTIDRLSQINHELGTAIERGDALNATRLDTEWHALTLESNSNPEIAPILGTLKLKARRLELSFWVDQRAAAESVVEHDRVIAGLRKRDLESTSAALADNWTESLNRYRESTKARNAASE